MFARGLWRRRNSQFNFSRFGFLRVSMTSIFRSAGRIPLVSIRSFAVQSKIAASPIRRFSSFSRVPVELGCWGGSLFPLHSAVAEGKLTSQLSSASRSARALSQGFVGRACPGP